MLKCTKFDFGWGSAPDLAEKAYSPPRTPSCIYGGLRLKGKEGGKGRGEEKGDGRRRKGRWEGNM